MMWIHQVWKNNFHGKLLSTYSFKLRKVPDVGPRVTRTQVSFSTYSV